MVFQGVHVILRILKDVIELLCGKTTSDTNHYLKWSACACLKTCLKGEL